ncbi:MAG: OmpH family outer membrane protein [Nonlabens sp.]
MKQIKNLIAAIAILFAGMSTVNAQATATKVCHVASQELVESLPEAIAAEKQLKKLGKNYETKLAEMDREIQTRYQNAQREAPNKTDEENERVIGEIRQGQQKLEEYLQNSQQAMAQKRTDLLKPLYKKVREAIFKVAREKGYEYVLDSTTGTGIIMADGYDLTPDVKAELGAQ